jgi:ubiquinone/menaquinone biosynthesis C-methylase UbiE
MRGAGRCQHGDGLAETLPAEAARFDPAVASIVLCSVADPARALSELRRVLHPGAELRFFEPAELEPADMIDEVLRVAAGELPIAGGRSSTDRRARLRSGG